MIISGLTKLTLLDYPDKIAATVFLRGCNFCCPFCHNKSLVIPQNNFPADEHFLNSTDIFDFLKSRTGRLSGVCISGGEPTLNSELPDFISKIKELGFFVKLDTNGSNPAMLKYLIDNSLIDYAAMDIKNSPDKYLTTCGLSNTVFYSLLTDIKESAKLLMSEKIDFEFRTTIVSEFHDLSDMHAIGKWLAGNENYYLQSFVPSEDVILSGLHAPSKDTFLDFQEVLKQYIPNVSIRGI